MKILENSETSPWYGKINFVDKNNVLVGFDNSQCCCEDFGWFVIDEIWNENMDAFSQSDAIEGLDDFIFDKEFFKTFTHRSFNEGGIAIFRLVNGDKEKYLHLYNSQNGYYGHGFEMKIGGKSIWDGCL